MILIFISLCQANSYKIEIKKSIYMFIHKIIIINHYQQVVFYKMIPEQTMRSCFDG